MKSLIVAVFPTTAIFPIGLKSISAFHRVNTEKSHRDVRRTNAPPHSCDLFFKNELVRLALKSKTHAAKHTLCGTSFFSQILKILDITDAIIIQTIASGGHAANNIRPGIRNHAGKSKSSPFNCLTYRFKSVFKHTLNVQHTVIR